MTVTDRQIGATKDQSREIWHEFVNAKVPLQIQPLLFDGKLIGLTKQSQMAQNVAELVARAEQTVAVPAGPGGASGAAGSAGGDSSAAVAALPGVPPSTA